jgi:hypothetical protein
MIEVVVLLELMVLHTLDARPWYLNPKQIVSLAPPKDNTLLVDGVGCIVSLTDAKWVAVLESCDQVRAMIRQTP